MAPEMMSSLFETLVGLGVVVLCIFAFAWLFGRIRSLPAAGTRHLSVISVLSVGQKERLLLVQVGTEQVLVGVCGAGMTRVHTLTVPIDSAHPADAAKSTAGAAFSTFLKSAMRRARP